MAAVVAAFEAFPEDTPAPVVALALSIVLILLCFGAFVLFNRAGGRRGPPGDPEKYVRELERNGLVVTADFQAKRAFGVEEFEDEGLHDFLELADGSVLFLSGPYLYDYEPEARATGPAAARRFPCSEFTVRRHRDDGFVVDLLCRGQVLEPELVTAPFGEADFRRGAVPEDGQVFRDRSYEAIKAELTERPSRATDLTR